MINLSLAFPASPFLAEINNEQMPRNTSYKARLESLDHLVLIMWSNDTTLIPPQSAHFGFFDASMKIQPLRCGFGKCFELTKTVRYR